MPSRPYALLVALVLAAVLAAVAAEARAAGGPTPGLLYGGQGVTGRVADARIVAIPEGDSTVVAQIRLDGGDVVRFRSLAGWFGVPFVAFDGVSTDGISADGRTLVLAELPHGRRPTTRFALLDARTLRVRRVVRLPGTLAFDAISPDGSLLYLVEHLAVATPRYVVRAYDVEAGRLLRQVVRDPRERERTMHGIPMGRATSVDGRWAYTLYAAHPDHAFIHALDTVGRRAVCVDLPGGRASLAAAHLSLAPDGRRLEVTKQNGRPLAVVDTRSLIARPAGDEPAAEGAAPGAARVEAENRDSGLPLALLLVGAAVVTGAGIGRRARRRVRS